MSDTTAEREAIVRIAKGLSEAMRNEWLSLEWTGEYYNPPRYFRRQFAQLGMIDQTIATLQNKREHKHE